MRYLFLGISLLLDGVVSNFFPFPSFFSLVAFLLIVPYYRFRETKYYVLAGIYGAIYDFIYTNSFGFYLLLFLLFAYFNLLFYKRYSYHLLNLLLQLIFLILCYQVIQYSRFLFLDMVTFSWNSLFQFLFRSLILNAIYLCISFPFFHSFVSK